MVGNKVEYKPLFEEGLSDDRSFSPCSKCQKQLRSWSCAPACAWCLFTLSLVLNTCLCIALNNANPSNPSPSRFGKRQKIHGQASHSFEYLTQSHSGPLMDQHLSLDRRLRLLQPQQPVQIRRSLERPRFQPRNRRNLRPRSRRNASAHFSALPLGRQQRHLPHQLVPQPALPGTHTSIPTSPRRLTWPGRPESAWC